MTEWDEMSDYDQAFALGFEAAQAVEAAEKCEACGGPKAECQDTDNQHAYEVTFRRCYRTRAVLEAQRGRQDMDGILTVVTLNPDKKKSARQKG